MTAIEFENISKQYQLGQIGTGTLSKDLNRWWAAVRGKEDPYQKIGQVNDRTKHADSDFVWALRDINLKIEQGDVVGIIGKNGSGKSTLLKILSKVTAPTTGRIRGRGRVASLLEVGTGFHPEMTGRENIYMNGAIMGMTKQEIDRKLDEIVDFAGVAKYLDTPVKRYSSGMSVRLGFAIAAHLEPEILVVDEVLAVGDAEFQKKAVGKMQDVSKGQGRTVLFVSHNMTAVKNLCARGILLENGTLAYDGTTDEAIDRYIRSSTSEMLEGKIVDKINMCHDYLHVRSIKINGTEECESIIKTDQTVLDVEVEGYTDIPIDCDIRIQICNKSGVILASLVESKYKGICYKFDVGEFRMIKHVKLPKYLSKGEYFIDFMIHRHRYGRYCEAKSCAILSAEGHAESFCPEPQLLYDGIMGLESI